MKERTEARESEFIAAVIEVAKETEISPSQIEIRPAVVFMYQGESSTAVYYYGAVDQFRVSQYSISEIETYFNPESGEFVDIKSFDNPTEAILHAIEVAS